MDKDLSLLAERYSEVLKEESSLDQWHNAQMNKEESYEKETGPDEAFKALENSLDKFYALGQKGLGGDASAIHDRVYNILQQRKVDDRDIKRFADALLSVILGQSTRGYADTYHPEQR